MLGGSIDADGEPTLDPERAAAAVEGFIREGSLFEAAHWATIGFEREPAPFEAVLDSLRAEGFAEEVEIVGVGRRNQNLIGLLAHANRWGWIGAAVTFLALVIPARLFAAVPAMAARVLVTEWVLTVTAPAVLDWLDPREQQRGRLLFDTAIYRTRVRYRLRVVDAVMLTIGGFAFWALFLVIRLSSDTSGYIWVAIVGAAVMVAAGPLALAATNRMRVLRPTPQSETDGAPPTRADVRLRGVVIGVLALTLSVTGLVTAVAIFDGPSASMDPESVPSGRPYSQYPQPDGSLGPAQVDCPSVADWMTGSSDTLCADTLRSTATAAGVVLVIDLLIAAGLASAVRSRRRLKAALDDAESDLSPLSLA